MIRFLVVLAIALFLIPSNGRAATESNRSAQRSIVSLVQQDGSGITALRRRCEKLIADRRLENQGLLNIGAGVVMGAGVGAIVGSFMGMTAWGAGLGGIYGGVVGHFAGQQADVALEQRMMEFCLKGALR